MSAPRSPPKPCPKCGKPMEAGYVIGQTWSGTYGATISWVPLVAITPKGRGDYETSVATKLSPVGVFGGVMSGGVLARRPRFPSWRCTNCKHIEFSYDERVVIR